MKIFSNVISFIRGIFTEIKLTNWLSLSQSVNYLLLILLVAGIITAIILASDYIFIQGRTALLSIGR